MWDDERPAGRYRRVLREGLREAKFGALIFLVSGFFLVVLPLLLINVVIEAIDGYRLSRGLDGTSGTVLVERIDTVEFLPICYGTFTPEDGGAAAEVQIEVPGECEIGQRAEARLADPRPAIFPTLGGRRAWADGADDWWVWILMLVIVAVPLVLGTIFAALCTAGSALDLAHVFRRTLRRFRGGA